MPNQVKPTRAHIAHALRCLALLRRAALAPHADTAGVLDAYLDAREILQALAFGGTVVATLGVELLPADPDPLFPDPTESISEDV